MGISITQAVLSQRISLRGRLAIPLERLRKILFDAQAARVIGTESGLGMGVPLIGGLAEVFSRLGIILRNPFSIFITLGKLILRPGAALGLPLTGRLENGSAAKKRNRPWPQSVMPMPAGCPLLDIYECLIPYCNGIQIIGRQRFKQVTIRSRRKESLLQSCDALQSLIRPEAVSVISYKSPVTCKNRPCVRLFEVHVLTQVVCNANLG